MTKDYLTSEPFKRLFAVFYLWYEGDSNLIDIFCGIATSLNSAINIANSRANGRPCEIFMPGQEAPDDGSYGDKRLRYRIAAVEADFAFEDGCAYDANQPATQKWGEGCDSSVAINYASMFSACRSLESLPDFSQAKEAWDSLDVDWQAVFAACKPVTEPVNEREKLRERRASWQRIQKLLCADN
jgi:hypothetical protein